MTSPLKAIDDWGSAIGRAWAEGFASMTKGVAALERAEGQFKASDPAPHVARAYHYECDGVCASDGKAWPCPTAEEYGL